MRVVVGVGTEGRGDDAAGLLVARALRGRAPSDVVVSECDGDPAELLGAWEGVSHAVVVDAMRSGDRPGTVRRVHPDRIALLASSARWSSHGLGLAVSLDLAAALGRRPSSLTVVGIEGAGFATGAPPSPALLAAVPGAATLALGALPCPAGAR